MVVNLDDDADTTGAIYARMLALITASRRFPGHGAPSSAPQSYRNISRWRYRAASKQGQQNGTRELAAFLNSDRQPYGPP
jgi:hypothetical protein